jgi:glycosyltransferase involved in cell wall biosynthesis
MRILVDLRSLETASGARGIGRYTRELAVALRKGAPSGWEIAGLSWNGLGKELGLEDLRYPGPRRGITIVDRFVLPGLLARGRFDLYHATAYALPARRPARSAYVLTIYDLIADLRPDVFTLRQRLAFRRTFRSSRSADRVLTISETTRRDLLMGYSLDPARVVAIPIGVSTAFLDGAGEGGPPSGFPRPFLLYVGGLDPLKNVPFLVEVLDRLRREEPGMRLVVAGEAGPRRDDLLERARRLGLGDHVLAPGFIDDRRLTAAYREAAAFVFPSRYEGFGLPPLEAMAAGCPVVSTTAGALAEVLGDAAIFASPEDAGGWAAAVVGLLKEAPARARLIERGRARAAGFTWERTARATLAAYEEAMRDRRTR